MKNMVSACGACTKNAVSQPKKPRSTGPICTIGTPKACVRVDLFNFGGKSHLVCVDRWGGYLFFPPLTFTTTLSVINMLKCWINILG